jgi:hypothetical protein
VRVDECKEWRDRAAAIASYAAQKRDRSLLEAAQRIRTRAEHRCGELIEETRKASRRPIREVAKAAGLTASETTRARALTKVKRDTFESHVERSPPTPITRLVKMGQSPTGADMSAPIWRFVERLRKHVVEFPVDEVIASVRALNKDERKAVLVAMLPASEWFDAIVESLEK